MPLVGSGHEIDPVSHLRMEKNHHGLSSSSCRRRIGERLLNGGEIVPVRLNHVPSEGFPAGSEVVETSYVLDAPVNLLVIVVGHRYQIVGLVVGGYHCCLPNLALLALPVSDKDIDGTVITVESLCKRGAEGYGKALPEGAGRLVHSLHSPFHAGMPLQA